LPGFVDSSSGGCECPLGQKNTNGKCEAIIDEPKTACEAAVFLPDPKITQLTDNSTLILSFPDGRDPTNITMLMRPKVGVRSASATDASGLLGLGQVTPGNYEIELAEGGTRCTLFTSVTVGCSTGYVAAGGVSGTCIKDTTACNATSEWRDPTTRKCRQKADMAVRASSDTLQMTLMKISSSASVKAQLEVRLKSGDVPEIQWQASLGTGSSWLSLSTSSGSVSSSQPVVVITVIANGTGLSDTAITGPMISSVTIRSTVRSNASKDSIFVVGAEVQTIPVHLTVTAVPYVHGSDLSLTSSSGRVVQPDEPVDAGDRLSIKVRAYDAQRMPISRKDLQMTAEFSGNLNGRYTAPLVLDSSGSNLYITTVPESWIREAEPVQSEAVLRHAALAAFRVHCGMIVPLFGVPPHC
jgi:hypothetical protein